jgi:RNA polymerase sigma factor (TIGR02999 family)
MSVIQDSGQLEAPASDSATTAKADAANAPDPSAFFQALHAELRRLARGALWKYGRDVSLSATTVVHEAYINMTLAKARAEFPDQARFLGYATKVMRGLVLNHVRQRRSDKRGGQYQFTPLDTQAAAVQVAGSDVEEVHLALQELAALDPALAQLVELSFFCGLTFAEIAALRGKTERTVQRDWNKARGLLRQSLHGEVLKTAVAKAGGSAGPSRQPVAVQ